MVVGVFAPLGYLAYFALTSETGSFAFVVRAQTLTAVWNTFALAAAVLFFGTLIAAPYAFLTTRARLRGERLFVLLGALPLAIPGYVLAMVWLGIGGDYGLSQRVLGVGLWRANGFWGATLALTVYTFPYLFLNLRAALTRLDPSLAEVARSHGLRGWALWRAAILPQVRAAYLAGALLVVLHVLADFGVTSLMRFETLSFAIYRQAQGAFDRTYAAWLSLVLVGLTAVLLFVDMRFLRGRLKPVSGATIRFAPRVALGRWTAPAYLYLVGVIGFSLLVPVAALFLWASQPPEFDSVISWKHAMRNSLVLGVGAAVCAPALVLPILRVSVRREGLWARLLERIPYLGYAIPPLPLALAFVWLTLSVVPDLYQTLPLLLAALLLRFLAEAVGPIRSLLMRLPERVEEASYALGFGWLATLRRVTAPLLRRGVLIAMAFVFLAVVKELPLTLILAPNGFDTLATNVWTHMEEAHFALAAPHALAILAVAGIFVTILQFGEQEQK